MENETAAIDNDVLLKLASYELLAETPETLNLAPSALHVLGAARFVVRDSIRRSSSIPDQARAHTNLETFLEAATEIEPTEHEVRLSTVIEELAIEYGVDLDTGESQLCAVTIVRALTVLITGDKRAITGLETLLDKMKDLAYLCGRVMCLEQLFLLLVLRLGSQAIRERVCTARNADRALTICCGCAHPSRSQESMIDGLRSYIRALREDAPRPLCEIS